MHFVGSIAQYIRFHFLYTLLVINFTKARFNLCVILPIQNLDITNKWLQLPTIFHFNSLVTTAQSKLSCEHLCIFKAQFRKFWTWWHFIVTFSNKTFLQSTYHFSSRNISQIHHLWKMLSQRYNCIHCYHFDSLVTTAQRAPLGSRYLYISLVWSNQILIYYILYIL